MYIAEITPNEIGKFLYNLNNLTDNLPPQNFKNNQMCGG